MAVDLEWYQRAWRLRHAADDGLMLQVFGEELPELQKANPALIDVARSYFPHLTSSTYEALAREPDNLKVEKDRCEREMEQLAVQNYSAFIGSAEVTQGVKQEMSSIRTHLQEMAETLEPTQDTIAELQSKAAGLSVRRQALRKVLAQHTAVLELLELPQLLDACVRNQMYEESLELLAFCNSLLQAHEARGEEIAVLSGIKEQVAVQRANLKDALASQLKTDIHLPACVRIVGFLRRVQRHSEDELRQLFIEHRSKFLESHKQQVELLRHSRGSVGTALRNAADLLRTHVYDIGTQYKALFPQDDGPLSVWLNSQVMSLAIALLLCSNRPFLTVIDGFKRCTVYRLKKRARFTFSEHSVQLAAEVVGFSSASSCFASKHSSGESFPGQCKDRRCPVDHCLATMCACFLHAETFRRALLWSRRQHLRGTNGAALSGYA